MRMTRVLAIALTLLSLGALAAPVPSHAAPAKPAAHVALIDLGGLFGDENEPDENEPDEGSGQASQQQSSGTSFGGLLLAVGAGMVAMIFVTRWFFRLRTWVRQLGRGGAA